VLLLLVVLLLLLLFLASSHHVNANITCVAAFIEIVAENDVVVAVGTTACRLICRLLLV